MAEEANSHRSELASPLRTSKFQSTYKLTERWDILSPEGWPSGSSHF